MSARELSISFSISGASMPAVNSPARIPTTYPRGSIDDDRWPCAHCIRAPHAELPVVDDWMADAEPLRCVADALGVAFGDELAAMHADDDQLARESVSSSSRNCGRMWMQLIQP